MKILLVSQSILPKSGGSSVIVENLAKNFKRGELIVLGSSEFFNKERVNRSKETAEFRYFSSELSFFGRGHRYFRWFKNQRFQPLVRHIKNLILKEKIEYVIGVYPDDFYCLAACRAAKDLGIPFSSYFHNTYIENQAITNPKAPEIQQEIFDYSDHIFVMSKGMQRFYEEKYRLKKFIPLVHTFNEFPNPETLTGIPKSNKKHYKLVAIGNFNESNLDATRRFLNAIKNNPKYSLSVYTHVPKMLLKMRGIDPELIDHKGSVAPDEIHAALQDFDICILTHGFTGGYGEIEYRTIFPTRTIPLLLSGKPIFAHSPKGSFLNDFIEENQCAELVDEASEKAILEGLERIVNDEDYQRKLVKAARKTANLFYGGNVVEGLRRVL